MPVTVTKYMYWGGDTNFDTYFSVSATAIANIFNRRPLMRTGIKPGDFLYASSKLGIGNAFAYSRFFDPSFILPYKPLARLNEINPMSQYASSCIGTSDGLFPALAVLSEINDIGFHLDVSLQNVLSNEVIFVIGKTNLPEWILLAGPHGEDELLFSIPAAKNKTFQKQCEAQDYHPVYLGRSKKDRQLNFMTGTVPVQCHPASIPILFYEAEGNVP